MKCIAIAKGFDGERRIDVGVVFELKDKVGKVLEGGKLVEKTITAAEQFSPKWMKEYKGKSVNIVVEGDFDPEEEEVVVMPKKKGKKGKSEDLQEVI